MADAQKLWRAGPPTPRGYGAAGQPSLFICVYLRLSAFYLSVSIYGPAGLQSTDHETTGRSETLKR
jgi:hypothetical protein